MDLVDPLGDSHLRSKEEVDNIHFPQDLQDHDEENHPSRPVSRLGFNRPASECRETHNAQWSRSLFQSIGVSELRLSAPKTHSKETSEADALGSAHSSSGIGENNTSMPSSIKEYFESPYGSAVEDTPKYAKVNRRSPSTSPPSVSRLSFPFVTTPSPRRNKSAPSQRHKYSCFPSLMSPEPATHPSPLHQRHSYRQHGYSRLALQHLKWFWSLRERKWETCNTDLRNVDDGVSPDTPLAQPAVILSSNGVLTPYAYSHQTPPMTVYPRRGDIAALHDPYSFQIDRCFAGLANWTIGKILWMVDVHAAAEKRKMEVDTEQDASDEESDGELEMSASVEFSDDSDSTLVESENESDSLTLRNAMLDSSISTINNDEATAEPLQIPSVGYLDNTNWSKSVYNHSPKLKKPDHNDLPWATNWYGRWTLLLDISRRDENRKRLLFESDASTSEFVPTIQDDTGPHFILTGKHKDLANESLWNSKLGNLDT